MSPIATYFCRTILLDFSQQCNKINTKKFIVGGTAMNEIRKIIKRRLMDNKRMFSNKELRHLNKTHEKIYLIGLADGKKIYN